eukprot:gene20884-biopygen15402
MPSRCVLPGCANKSDKSKSIGLHKIPFYEDDRPEAVERRQRWVDFIASELADEWNLSKETAMIKDLEKEFIQPSTSQAHKRAGNEVKVNKLRRLKSPRKGTQQRLDEASDTEDSDADLCEDFLYEADNFVVEDEVMSESSYAHSQYTEDTDMDSDTEEPNDLNVSSQPFICIGKIIHFNLVQHELGFCLSAYIQDVYRTLEESLKNPGTLEAAASELKALTPSFMDAMLQKQPRELAVKQWQHRQSLVAVDVPPTTPGS